MACSVRAAISPCSAGAVVVSRIIVVCCGAVTFCCLFVVVVTVLGCGSAVGTKQSM